MRRRRRRQRCFPPQRKDDRKSQHAERAQRGAGGIERGRLLPAALAGKARFPLSADFMLLDQRGAGAEDGGKGEKETPDRCSIAAADEAGEDGRGAAKREADQIFVPAAFLAVMTAKSGSASCLSSGEGTAGRRRPISQTTSDSNVAGRARSRRANEKMADDDAIDGKRDRARHHRLALQGRVAGSVLIDGDAERSERDRGRGPEQAREAFGTQNVSQHRESRHDGAADKEADEVLGHFAFFQSFDSGPPVP